MGVPRTVSVFNRRLKHPTSWVVLTFLVVAMVAVGATREGGPQTAGQRIDQISRRLACPVCDGESVFESRNNASDSIRAEITAQVSEGRLTDDQIIELIASRFGGQVLLVPRSSGIEALAWAIPAVALVMAIAGLAITFRRWRRESAAYPEPTAEDFARVAAALAAEEAADRAATDSDSYRSDEAGQE